MNRFMQMTVVLVVGVLYINSPGQALGQSDVLYSCPPCGCDVDGTPFEEPGRCPSCRMKLLPEGEHIDYAPRVSPDGGKIAFLTTRDDDLEIYVMNTSGGALSRLTNSPDKDEHISWSPDSRRIAFTSYRTEDLGDIYLMNADGSEPTNLTKSTEVREFQPAFSPDGRAILYAGSVNGMANIYVMDADGSNTRQLTTIGSCNDPRWLNAEEFMYFRRVDGTRIAFSKSIRTPSKEKKISYPANSHLSPDGSRIVFAVRGEDRNSEIFIMNSDGSEKRQLTDTPSFDNDNPVWSPSGTQIFFDSDRDGGHRIFVMNFEGTKQKCVLK